MGLVKSALIRAIGIFIGSILINNSFGLRFTGIPTMFACYGCCSTAIGINITIQPPSSAVEIAEARSDSFMAEPSDQVPDTPCV